jgi:hypothetical protein
MTRLVLSKRWRMLELLLSEEIWDFTGDIIVINTEGKYGKKICDDKRWVKK